MRYLIFLFLSAALLAACGERPAAPTMSVNDLMVDVIAPQSDILWALGEPASDEDWQRLAAAAQAIVAAGQKLEVGGSGPNDEEWAAQPEWQAFVAQMSSAAVTAHDAALANDLDAFYAATDVLYPPCEDCHLKFHPGVAGQDLN